MKYNRRCDDKLIPKIKKQSSQIPIGMTLALIATLTTIIGWSLKTLYDNIINNTEKNAIAIERYADSNLKAHTDYEKHFTKIDAQYESIARFLNSLDKKTDKLIGK